MEGVGVEKAKEFFGGEIYGVQYAYRNVIAATNGLC